ncbi:MAG: DUF1963 domain-containing protein, partial [Chitinophagaceae bacterium]
HWPEIRNTRLSSIALTTIPSDEPGIKQSKIGHYPYLPLDAEYPRDAEGKWMFPLAQINFAELPGLHGYPGSGYLQFYISGFDDVYGLDFDDPQSQENFRVLFFEERDITTPKTEFDFLQEVMSAEGVPVTQSKIFKFAHREEYVGVGDFRHDDNQDWDLFRVVEQYPEMEKQLQDALYDSFYYTGHKIGGYAAFSQHDPRMNDPRFAEYILLFQLEAEEGITWGDSGIANFFIHPDDLAKKDFSKVLYNWDCF